MTNQNIKLNINHDGKTVKSLNIPAGTNGQAVHVSAQDNVTYQFIDDNTHLAPQDMVAKRNGENLVISFKGGNLDHPDLIIDNYYSPNIHTSANNLLLGEGNHSSFYIPPASNSDTLGLVAEEVQNTASTTEASLLQQTVHSGFGLFAGMVAVGTAESIYLAHMSEKGHVVHHDTPPASSVTPPPVAPVTPSVAPPPVVPVTPPVAPPKEADYTLEVDPNNNYKILTIHDNGHIDFSKFAHQNIREITLDNDALPQHIHITPEEVALIAPIQKAPGNQLPAPYLLINSLDPNDTVDNLSDYKVDHNGYYINKNDNPNVVLNIFDELLPIPQDVPYYYRPDTYLYKTLTLNQQIDLEKFTTDLPKDYDNKIDTINMGSNGVGEHITISGKLINQLSPDLNPRIRPESRGILKVYSADTNDKVTVDGLIRDSSRDYDENHIHYDAYISPEKDEFNHDRPISTAFIQHELIDKVIPPKESTSYNYLDNILYIHDNTPIDFSHIYAVERINLDNDSVAQTLKVSINDLINITAIDSYEETQYISIHSHDTNDRVILEGIDNLQSTSNSDFVTYKIDAHKVHYSITIDNSLINPTPPNSTYTIQHNNNESNNIITLYGENPSIDYEHLHNVKFINMGNNGVSQHLTLSSENIKSLITDNSSTTKLHIYSQDKGDSVTLEGMKADPEHDYDLNHIHYQHYIDPTNHTINVYVQEGLIA